jgi:hypothetical protein
MWSIHFRSPDCNAYTLVRVSSAAPSRGRQRGGTGAGTVRPGEHGIFRYTNVYSPRIVVFLPPPERRPGPPRVTLNREAFPAKRSGFSQGSATSFREMHLGLRAGTTHLGRLSFLALSLPTTPRTQKCTFLVRITAPCRPRPRVQNLPTNRQCSDLTSKHKVSKQRTNARKLTNQIQILDEL